MSDAERKRSGAPSVPYNPPRARAAARAREVVDGFLSERKSDVCRPVDPVRFARSPGDFVYTRDHCRIRGDKKDKKPPAPKQVDRDADAREIETIKDFIRSFSPAALRAELVRERASISKALPTLITSMVTEMLLPFNRAKYPDPFLRYEHISKQNMNRNRYNPRTSVMHQTLYLLISLNSDLSVKNITKDWLGKKTDAS